MKLQTIQKSYTQKDGTIWEWTETPELRAFITQAESKTVQENLNDKPKRTS
jgi:hypothetical protein